ncbi:MAG: RluA family pseudouridine synthase [Gemmatimonadota bacterium]|nr:RluA family pseudouridine synthase [Gemmatimonadota bacterium]
MTARSSGDLGDFETHRVRLDTAADRVDKGVAGLVPLSRTKIQGLIDDGLVTVDGRVVEKPSEPVEAGAEVVVRVPPKAEPTLEPAPIPLSILWEDDACLVVDKPAGLVVHPAPGHPDDTLVNALLHHRPGVSGVGSEKKSGLVHRLDMDTSGCILIAKSDAAHAALSSQFADRTIDKTYWAFTWGHMGERSGVVDRPIGRSVRDRQKMSSRTAKGRSAVTRWEVLERYAVAEWLEVDLETGRTHQIRVHFAESGHPVIGDDRYGGGPVRAKGFHGPQQAWAREAAAAVERQALHARAIGFDHPETSERVEVSAPIPDDLDRLRGTLREHRA